VVVLVEDTAEAIAPVDVAGRSVIERGDGSRRVGRAQLKSAVGPMLVVVGHIDAQYVFELVARDHQQAVEAFLAQGPDPTLGERVRVGGPYRGSDDSDAVGGKDGVETRSELGVAVSDQKPKPTRPLRERYRPYRGGGLVG
jgi:hypothetical protein